MIKKHKLGLVWEWKYSAKHKCNHIGRYAMHSSMPKSRVDDAIKCIRSTDCPKCELKALMEPV